MGGLRFNPRTPCGVRLVSFGIVNVPHGFNPRTPCGVRQAIYDYATDSGMFQSTHSLRSATPCLGKYRQQGMVSIHALLAECDSEIINGEQPGNEFQSTHSLRSATKKLVDNLARNDVSIHALLAECDDYTESVCAPCHGFNPRTPCGVRQMTAKLSHGRLTFQSTHSLRSATWYLLEL